MGRLYIPSQNEIDGPWLLSYENLKTLDDLFNHIDQKLKEALVKTIESTAKQQMEEDNQSIDLSRRIAKLQKKYNQKVKFAEVTFSDGSTYEAEEIEGIINYVDTHPTFIPKELYIKTIQGNYENEFDLIINSSAKDKEIEFEYRIKCIDEEIQQKVKTLIDKWIRENKPNRLLQIWTSIVPIVLFVAIFTALFSGIAMIDTSPDYKKEYEKAAKGIIERGVTQTNRDSAIVLILKMQSDYIPDDTKSYRNTSPNTISRRIFTASFVVFIISLVIPKTVIGIGKKYNSYKLYKIWIWVISAMLLTLIGALYERFWNLFGL